MKHSDAAKALNDAIGQNIRTARLAKNLSQAKIGEALGLTFQQVQKYENGTNRVSAAKLLIIAKTLGVPAADLLPKIDNLEAIEHQPDALTTLGHSRDGHELARAFNDIKTPKLRHAIVALAEAASANGEAAGP